MNILYLIPYAPFPSNRGAKLRTASFIYALHQHQLTICLLHQGGQIDTATLEDYSSRYHIIAHHNPLSGNKWHKIRGWLSTTFRLLPTPVLSEHNVVMEQTIQDLFSQQSIEYIVVEFPWLMPYALPYKSRAKIILNTHNLESEGFLRTRGRSHLLWYWIWKRYEKWAVTQADYVIVTSQNELTKFQSLQPAGNYQVIPNAIDIAQYQLESKHQPSKVIFTGALDYLPNIQAVELLINHIWPLVKQQSPHATLDIVGSNPPNSILQWHEQQDIRISANVPDIKPYIAQATVAVVPITAGAGTRLKILEAFALGTPVVSTSLGAEGLAVESGKHLIIANQPADIAEAIVSMLNQPKTTHQAMIKQARKLVEEQYSWQSVQQLMNQLLQESTP